MTMHQNGTIKIGIDDMSFYVPRLYLPIRDLAEARNLDYGKLNKGLGLATMAVPDVGEDAATLAANAVLDLLRRNEIDPRTVGRIYLGTESALDGAKPTATYVLDMLGGYFEKDYGPDCFRNCDVVDLTFACIGAVDALQNTLDWVRGGAGRIGIVVASDVARYELGSGGEYTQGAGAVALLVRHNPRLLALGDHWGVATQPVHDFFKPLRKVGKRQVIEEVLRLAGVTGVDPDDLLDGLHDTIEVNGILDTNDVEFTFQRETPVFDGPYSNDCYRARIREALAHFSDRAGLPAGTPVTDRWSRLVFHLPYAYQARRMFPEIFLEESRRRGDWPQLEAAVGLPLPIRDDYDSLPAYEEAYARFLRAVSKTESYRVFVADRIEAGERASSLVGNLYTASIFLALMSTLEACLDEGQELRGKKIGFFAYGSGSKSKVFEAEVQPAWRDVTARFQLMKTLKNRRTIDYSLYEELHRGQRKDPVGDPDGRFYLGYIETEDPNYLGARGYTWKTPVGVTY